MTEQHYIREVFSLLLERSRDALGQARAEGSDLEDRAFAKGLAQGYYETISLMLGQLEAFGIDRSAVGIPEDLSPERDLL